MKSMFAKVTAKLLGNGKIVKRDNMLRFSFRSHAEDIDWIRHCCESLQPNITISNPSLDANTYFAFSEAPIIYELYQVWYKDKQKILPLDFLELYFNEVTLAWWYQDVGHLKKKKNGTLEKIILSTEQWTTEELALLQYMLNLKFGLLFATDGQNRLILYDQLQMNYFLQLIAPWMHPSMTRKMKTVSVLKPIAKRTTITLPSSISIKTPTATINQTILLEISNLNLTEDNFKRINYQTLESNETKSYQITLSEENRQAIQNRQACFGLTMNQIVQECFHIAHCKSPPKLESLDDLTTTQQNIILASILGDGMLQHYPSKTLGIRSAYYEHFGIEQYDYRAWKVMKMQPYLHFLKSRVIIISRVTDLWSSLEPLFYFKEGTERQRIKRLPNSILSHLNDKHSLLTLYLDDGSLMISFRVNHSQKKIYLTPHINLYLQNFTYKELLMLKSHLQLQFSISLTLARTPSGNGYTLRTFRIEDTLLFLDAIKRISMSCPSMIYKTNWDYRWFVEKSKWQKKYPTYEILLSSRERMRPYTEEEIELLITMKKEKYTNQQIANQLGRTYWSVVYKLQELRKSKLL